MKLVVDKISGFKSRSPLVYIEKDGMIFYKMERRGTVITFNLPAGKYDVIDGDLEPADVIHYPRIPLPEPNFPNARMPENMNIRYETNKHKATVDTSIKNTLTVCLDWLFQHLPEFVGFWVLGHEAGHFLYRGKGVQSEMCCDLFGCNVLFDMGFNPSQVQMAIDMALSENLISEHRKELMYESLQYTEESLKNLERYEHG